MDTEELVEEIKIVEDIIEIRKYRFRKEMHELNDDLDRLRKRLAQVTEETSKVTVKERKRAKASIDE